MGRRTDKPLVNGDNVLFVHTVRHLHVGQGDDADVAVWTSCSLPKMFHPHDPVRNRRPFAAAQVYRLQGECSQAGTVQS